MAKRWIEIRAGGPISAKDDIISALIEAGSPGVLECEPDKKGLTGAKSNLEIKAYLPHSSLKSAPDIKALKIIFKDLKWKLTLNEYEEEDWSVKWKEAIHPVTITENVTGTKLIIKATWHKIEAQDKKSARRAGEGSIIINIDPSMAFGTGSHPSTKMCIRALSYITLSEDGNGAYGPIKSLLDIGSGTGILSIAAKKLNVAKTIGIDIDPITIKIAQENAKLNKVKCTFKEGSTLDDIKSTFDIVMANIISSELLKLKEQVAEKVKPGAFIVLSGILSEEAREVEDAYRALGLSPYMRYAESGTNHGGGSWVALVLRKAY